MIELNLRSSLKPIIKSVFNFFQFNLLAILIEVCLILKERKIALNQIISHEKGLHLFMRHLAKEFSMECMLCVIEFIQYQDYIFKKILEINGHSHPIINDNTKLIVNKYQIRLPDTIPISEIVSNLDDHSVISNEVLIRNGKMMAYKLYEKYVEFYSHFKINVRSGTRKLLMKKMENKEITEVDLCFLFDQCCKEMIALLYGCSVR